MIPWISQNSYRIDLMLADDRLLGLLAVALMIALILLLAARLSRVKSRVSQPGELIEESNPGQPRALPVTLRCTLVDATGQTWLVDNLPFQIGRSLNNELVLPDPSISAHHARIFHHPALERLAIEDLGSLNGMLIDGKPTCMNLLMDAAQLTLGRMTFTIQISPLMT